MEPSLHNFDTILISWYDWSFTVAAPRLASADHSHLFICISCMACSCSSRCLFESTTDSGWATVSQGCVHCQPHCSLQLPSRRVREAARVKQKLVSLSSTRSSYIIPNLALINSPSPAYAAGSTGRTHCLSHAPHPI